MMRTISSSNSLLIWKHNVNGSGITESCIGGDVLLLKTNYESLFRSIANLLKEKNRVSFVDMWQRECDRACSDVTCAIASHGDFKTEDIDLVVNKFRGNCGEILVEMLAENGVLDFIVPGSYVSVDPENEKFVDAEAIGQNGFPIGIQVKNYHRGNCVSSEVLTKAAAMSDLWLRHDRRIKDEDVLDFLKSPCQYVVSMTDVKSDLISERYLKSVVFLGPKWLDTKKIQGSSKTGENAKWRMFEKTADEMSAFEI